MSMWFLFRLGVLLVRVDESAELSFKGVGYVGKVSIQEATRLDVNNRFVIKDEFNCLLKIAQDSLRCVLVG
ncbi:hypothetical protein F5Y16DRAFT_393014 [Xylariaceae sp. FL0255]|nr:hypothetical protein F5Y16DRAFT_393014 [Xylariaceae sp. FL0255]